MYRVSGILFIIKTDFRDFIEKFGCRNGEDFRNTLYYRVFDSGLKEEQFNVEKYRCDLVWYQGIPLKKRLLGVD